MFGSGTEAMRPDLDLAVGHNVRDLYDKIPDMLDLHFRLMAGHSVNQLASDGRQVWWIEAVPMFEDGVVVGANGVSYPLEPEVPAPATRRRTWRMEGLPASRGSRHRNGDVFVKVDGHPGVGFCGEMTDGDFMAHMMEFGRYMNLVEDASPPCRLPSPASPLRLLP